MTPCFIENICMNLRGVRERDFPCIVYADLLEKSVFHYSFFFQNLFTLVNLIYIYVL